MFFRKLELHGFKSFGNRTVVDFQDGFTVVVGPNGCGKSNILDAIRWVLGETSAKSLRGGRMSDVVFEGTSTMKKAGLAQVTLTVDNTRGTLKIDATEVAITRRLFANGDSEYLINKQPCRMRDIHELFLDTGLGADGYAIIEQGRIGDIIKFKPNERREIFEEAAGISRYKMRREETVRKLARTSEDLARLEDIVSEVERQCNSLRNQARKAQRHRRHARRLHRLQQRLLVTRHDQLSGQLAGTQEKLAARQKAFEEVATKLAQAEAAVVGAQQQIDDAQNENQKLQQHRFDLRRALDQHQHTVEMLNQRMTTIDERITAITREIESRDARRRTLSGTLEALEADLARSEQVLGSHNAEMNARIEALNAIRRQSEQANRELAELRRDLADLRATENTLQNDKRLAEGLLQRLDSEMGATEFAIGELDTQIEQATAEVEKHRATVQDLARQLEETRAESQSLKDEIGRGDAAHKELADRLTAITRELNHARSRRDALVELEENYEGYYRGVKEVMRAAEQSQLDGIVGVVSSILRVPAELDVAVEVALGGDLQDIVTRNVHQAKAAIQYLKERNLGRATFLPLDFLHYDFHTQHLERIWGRPGVLGLGRDLVGYDEDMKPAAWYLFGNTVFVEKIDVALDLEREGIRNRFVSLSGDVVNPRGVLSGGSHKTHGLLSRQREIQQLTERVRTLEADLQRLTDEVTSAQDRLGILYARAAELQARAHQLEKEENSAQKDLQQAERDMRERRTQRATIDARLTQQRIDKNRQAEIIERCDGGLAELSTKIATTTQNLEQHETQTRELLAKEQELNEAAVAARASYHGVEQQVDNLRVRLRELRDSMEESEREREAREAERLALRQEREQAEVDREETEQTIGNLAREAEAYEARIAEFTARVQTLTNDMRGLQAETQRLQRDRNEADNNLREVQMLLAEVRAQAEYLEREVEDEFAMTIAEVRADLAAAEEAARQWRERQAAGEGAPVVEAATETAAEESDEEAAVNFDDEEPATTPEDDAITDPAVLRNLVAEIRGKLQRLGAVNEAAIDEYRTQSERLTFLVTQRDDMVEARRQLEEAIQKIDETTKQLFADAYENIRQNFRVMYTRLFNGGEADLKMIEDERYPEPGIEIFAQPPGKKIGSTITLLSGGEQALTAIALTFALFQYRPSPICVLDEIDAPLDDPNTLRLCDCLRQFAADTQFLIITHQKLTMRLADTIYGVTMQEPGVSKLVSVKFNEVEEQGLLQQPQHQQVG